MKSLENRESLSNFRKTYRISVGSNSNNKKSNQTKLQNVQDINKSLNNGYRRHRRSFEHQNNKTQERMSESAPFSTVVPMEKGQLLAKMTSLSKFITQRSQNPTSNQKQKDGISFLQQLEDQIQRDCNQYLQKAWNKHQTRSIIHKKLYKSKGFEDQFLFQRSNTF